MQMRRSLLMALDPARLALAATGAGPDPWQADVLRSDERQVILLCSRQAGKSTVSALLAIHEIVYRAPALVLLLAPTLRQAKLLFKSVKAGFDALGRPVRVVAETSTEMELANGSAVIALPGDEANIRGFAGVRLLVVDEASRVPDALYQAVRPMLAVSGGRIILLSTPWGKRGFFHDVWEGGAAEWKRVLVTAEDCPRISEAFLESERRELPRHVFESEYLCMFNEPLDAVFSYADVQRALDTDATPLFEETAA